MSDKITLDEYRAIPAHERWPRPIVTDMHSPEDPAPPKRIIVLLHGIRSRGEWTSYIRRELEFDRNTHVFSIRYPRISRLGFLRWLATRDDNDLVDFVANQIRYLMRRHGVQVVSVQAHSFGAYILTRVVDRHRDIKFDKILMFGSAAHHDFPWSRYEENCPTIVNDCGQRDAMIRFAGDISRRLGYSGRFGFNDVAVHDRYHGLIKHNDFYTKYFPVHYWKTFLDKGIITDNHGDIVDDTPIRAALGLVIKSLATIGRLVKRLIFLPRDLAALFNVRVPRNGRDRSPPAPMGVPPAAVPTDSVPNATSARQEPDGDRAVASPMDRDEVSK